MKKGALPHLFMTEMEPGCTAQVALTTVHPLAIGIPAGPLLQPILNAIGTDKPALQRSRSAATAAWTKRAQELRSRAVALIRQHPDKHPRKLYGHGVDPLPAHAESTSPCGTSWPTPSVRLTSTSLTSSTTASRSWASSPSRTSGHPSARHSRRCCPRRSCIRGPGSSGARIR